MSKGASTTSKDKEMISDSTYIEMLKNCSKWNSRVMNGRTRSQTAVYDQQTGIVHRPTEHLFRQASERCRAKNPMQVYVYPPVRWVKSKNVPSAAIEFNYFMKVNPALKDAVNSKLEQSQPQPATIDTINAETQSLSGNNPTRSTTVNAAKIYDNELDLAEYDLDEPEFNDQSDEEDWGSSKKKRKRGAGTGLGNTASRSGRRGAAAFTGGTAASTSTSNTNPIVVKIPKSDTGGGGDSASGGTPSSSAGTPGGTGAGQASSSGGVTASDPRPFVCTLCGAKYKSRPGLTYHKIHVHQSDSNSETPKSPSTPISY